MLPVTRRISILTLPSAFIRLALSTMPQEAHYKPPVSSQSPPVPSSMTLALSDDKFNNPDPTQYCKNLGVECTVSILQNWITLLDLNKHFPRLPEAGNLAALVPHNECLRKLIELGVDLSRMESEPGVANLLVKTDFDSMITPKLWLLSDFGFELTQVARIMTYIPKTIIKSSADEIVSRLKYFTDREFITRDIVLMISDQPQILALSSYEVDRRLGTLMDTFNFRAEEVRLVASSAPKCIVRPIKSTKDIFVVLTKMLGFSVPTARCMVVGFPRIILSSNRVLSANALHLNRRLGLSFEEISLYPRALCAPPRILEERTNFLKLYHRFQPDCSRPLYTSLDAIVEGSDEDFCLKFFEGKEDIFNDYLRTL